MPYHRSEEHTSELQSLTNLVCRIIRSEEHTSELQSLTNLVCRLLLEKKQITVLYFVIIILIYSFFSLIILGNIKKFAFNHKHDLSLYKRMFFLNLVLFIMFFILLVIFNIILTLIINKSVWIASIIFVLMALIIIMAYAFYNFSHSAFILGHELRSNLKQSFRNIFTKSYWGIILFNLIILGIYVLVYILLGAAFGDIIATNYTQYVNTSSIVSLVLIYVLYTFNRIYFFFITEKKLGIKKSSAHD